MAKVPLRPRSPDPIRWWNSRGTALAVGVVGSVAGALVYAGPSAAEVAYRLVADGGLALVWLACASGIGALFSRRDNDSPRPPGSLVYLVTAAGIGLGVLSLCALGLGLAGWLNQATDAGLLCAGAAAGAFKLANNRDGVTAAAGELTAWWGRPAGWGWAWLVVVPPAAVAVVGTTVLPGLLWKPSEPLGYDVVEYHLQIPREWYEAGRIVPLPHNAFSFFPFNVEMHYLLGMHLKGGPYAAMYLAQVMHFALVLLTILAACAFAARLAPAGGSVVVAGVAAAGVPWLAQLAAIAYNEGGFLLYTTLAVGWALEAVTDPRRRVRRFVLAGAMAGFACGAKLTAVPEVLLGVPLVGAVVVLATAGRGGRVGVLAGPAAFGLAGLLTFAPWLVRNQVWVGNPVFPEAAAVLGRAHFTPTQVERWRLAHAPQPAQRSLLRFAADPDTGRTVATGRLAEGWREVLAGWQFGYVVIPLGVIGFAVRRRERATWFLGGMFTLLAVFWLGFTHLQGRFFLPAVPLCVMLAAQVRWGKWMPAVFAAVALAAVPGGIRLHRLMADRLYGTPGGPGGVAEALGNTDVGWITAGVLEGKPADAPLLLVGEAKAFWYPLPPGCLSYRTVFDADTTGDRGVKEAWDVAGARAAGAWVLVDPEELERFAQTYAPFPPPPADWAARPEWRGGQPFLLPPGERSAASSRGSVIDGK